MDHLILETRTSSASIGVIELIIARKTNFFLTCSTHEHACAPRSEPLIEYRERDYPAEFYSSPRHKLPLITSLCDVYLRR